MARITVEDCLKRTGHENRFSLIHLAIERVKQHRDGQTVLVDGKNKEVVMALREIAAGLVTADNIYDFDNQAVGEKKALEIVGKEEALDSSN